MPALYLQPGPQHSHTNLHLCTLPSRALAPTHPPTCNRKRNPSNQTNVPLPPCRRQLGGPPQARAQARGLLRRERVLPHGHAGKRRGAGCFGWRPGRVACRLPGRRASVLGTGLACRSCTSATNATNTSASHPTWSLPSFACVQKREYGPRQTGPKLPKMPALQASLLLPGRRAGMAGSLVLATWLCLAANEQEAQDCPPHLHVLHCPSAIPPSVLSLSSARRTSSSSTSSG